MSSISSRCLPGCEVTCPEPCTYSRSLGPCVASCGDSTAVVYAPPVVLTFPGVIVNSCPQETIVGSSFPQPSSALPSSSSGMGGSYGSGGSFGSGGMSGMGGSSGFGGSYGSGGMSGMRGSSGSGGSYGSGGMSGMGGCCGSGGSYGSGGSSGIGGCYSRRFYSSTSRGSRLGN